MFICLAREPRHEQGDCYTPAFCSDYSPEPPLTLQRRSKSVFEQFE